MARSLLVARFISDNFALEASRGPVFGKGFSYQPPSPAVTLNLPNVSLPAVVPPSPSGRGSSTPRGRSGRGGGRGRGGTTPVTANIVPPPSNSSVPNLQLPLPALPLPPDPLQSAQIAPGNFPPSSATLDPDFDLAAVKDDQIRKLAEQVELLKRANLMHSDHEKRECIIDSDDEDRGKSGLKRKRSDCSTSSDEAEKTERRSGRDSAPWKRAVWKEFNTIMVAMKELNDPPGNSDSWKTMCQENANQAMLALKFEKMASVSGSMREIKENQDVLQNWHIEALSRLHRLSTRSCTDVSQRTRLATLINFIFRYTDTKGIQNSIFPLEKKAAPAAAAPTSSANGGRGSNRSNRGGRNFSNKYGNYNDYNHYNYNRNRGYDDRDRRDRGYDDRDRRDRNENRDRRR